MRTTRLEGDGPCRAQIRVVDLDRARAVEMTCAVRGAVERRLAALLATQRPRRPAP
ncbi:hypothetical protein ACFY4I_12960 [Streptomyces scabiei]|uniref:hypothetical protein n=1 Tax=Streptomyces scabiei TaxID=1930 RepID=UPI0036B2AC64